MDHLWAGWRSTYITGANEPDPHGCLFCRLPDRPDAESLVITRGETVFTALNRYPYTTGHVMIAPIRHVAQPVDLSDSERSQMWESVAVAQRAIQHAMSPDGFNLGANLGRVAGAGVPHHFHLHLVPRWQGDANFMTTIGETRVLPEDLGDTWEKLRAALVSSPPGERSEQ
jgi:ATP adenylyltransferase